MLNFACSRAFECPAHTDLLRSPHWVRSMMVNSQNQPIFSVHTECSIIKWQQSFATDNKCKSTFLCLCVGVPFVKQLKSSWKSKDVLRKDPHIIRIYIYTCIYIYIPCRIAAALHNIMSICNWFFVSLPLNNPDQGSALSFSSHHRFGNKKKRNSNIFWCSRCFR